MPPKKDKKKGKADIAPAAIDPADFQRETFELPVLGGVSSLDKTILGDFFNAELLFDEWNDEENWTEISDGVKEIVVKYPNIISYAEDKSVLEHLNVARETEIDPKKAKKGKQEALVLEDAIVDESGKPLPRIFIGSTDNADEFLSNVLTTKFSRHKLSKFVLPPVENECVESREGTDVEKAVVMDNECETAGEATSPAEEWGLEIDYLMTDTFRLISRFYQSEHNATYAPFLWRAIYPQLANGKPVLNKTGKYCVKLFVAGAWRKVSVLDVFPFENGQISLASSINPLELWPTILAKAVYTVYTACGYHHTMLGSNGGIGDASLQKASFSAFALHTLTGWIPAAPWSLRDVCKAESYHLQLHLDEMQFGGVAVCSQGAIPREAAIVAVPEDESIAQRQKTKKQLKDLILKRRMEKDNLIKAITKREELIDAIHAEVTKSFSEVFFIYSESTSYEAPRLYPVLAMCHDNPNDFMDTRLLVNWNIHAKVVGDVPDSDADVPASTPVTYQWISVRDLCAKGVSYVCGLDTKIRVPQVATHGWHWENAENVEENAKGKGKAAPPKGKDKGAPVTTRNPIGVPHHGSDRGAFPPVLLKIQGDQRSGLGEEVVAGEEESKTPVEVAATDDHFSLCVQLHADITSMASQGDGAEEFKEGILGISDDVVVILQEVRSDGEDPLVMRVQLSRGNPFPLARTTFHIPKEKIPSGAVLFLLRVFTTTSLHMSFSCPAPVEVGLANEVWGSSGGVSQVLRDRTQPTHTKAEQILFRIPLKLAPLQEDQNDTEDSVFFYLHTTDRLVMATFSLVAIDTDNKETHVLPTVSGNCFRLHNAQSVVTVVGRCMHATMNIPEFEWHAYLLSRRALCDPSELISLVVPEKSPRQRYRGEYVANNKLRVFRDVIGAVSTEFPLALRLSMHASEDQDSETKAIELVGKDNFVDVNEHLWFTASLYRKSDNKLVSEHHCRSIMQLYMLDKHGFLSDPDAPVVADTSVAKGKTKPPVDKKKGAKDVGDLVEFILDVTIDESRMRVPEQWRSRFPFRFRKMGVRNVLGGMDERSIDSSEVPQEPQFSWQLDILGGKVTKMHHDLFLLERFASIKNAWDEAEAGRRGKGHSARMYLNIRAGKAVEEEGGTAVSDLVEALGKNEAVLQEREDRAATLPQYKEHIEEIRTKVVASLVTEAVIQTENDFNALDSEQRAADAEATLLKFDAFNVLSRQSVSDRITVIRGQTSSNYEEAIALWANREVYSADVEKKNEALKFFLGRATEAIETAFPDENVDPKVKGKAKPKKK